MMNYSPPWPFVRLADVCEKITDGTHRSPPGVTEGVLYVTAKNIKKFRIDLTDLTYVSPEDHKAIYARCDPRRGDVLYIKDGATMGIAAVNTLDCEFSMLSSVALIRPIRDLLRSDYLTFWLNHPETYRAVRESQTGSAIQRMILDQIREIEIPLPSLAAQERIAARLTEQLAAVESARAAAQTRLAAAEALPAAYLREVFEGPEAGEWDRKPLSELCEGAGQYGTSQRSNGQKRGLPVLGMANIHEGRIRWEKVSFVDLSPDEENKYLLQPGDLLFNRTNSAELVGKTAVFDGDCRAVFASYLIRFRVREGIADPRFVASFINSRLGRAFIERHMGRAIGQVNISASIMAELDVPCPSLSVQKRLCDYIDRCVFVETGHLKTVLCDELAGIDALPAALLREAFNGQA